VISGKEFQGMKTSMKKFAAFALLLALSLAGRAAFAAALNALDDLGAYGTNNTLTDPDFYIRGFSILGSSNILTHISTGTGNVVINGQLEVSNEVYVVKTATFTGGVYLGANTLYLGGGSTGQILHKDPGGWLSWTDVASVSDNLGSHIATATLDMAGNSIINAASGTFTQGVTASSFTASDPSLGVNAAKFRFNNSNLIISSASSAQYGGIYISTNLLVGATYYGDGSAMTGVDIRYNVTRTLKAAGTNVNIGTFNTSGGNHSLYVSVTAAGSDGWSASKQYAIPMSYSMTGGLWRDALPISNRVSVSTNDFVLEVNIGLTAASLRLRRTAGSADGNAVINIEQLGPTADVFTPSSSAGASSANALLPVTALTQSGGKVGLGTGSPSALLHLSSGTLLIDGNAANSIILNGNVGIGTTNPTQALYVVGNATFTQTVTASTFNAVSAYMLNNTVTIDSLRGVYPKTLTVEQPVTLSTLSVTGSDFSVWGSTFVAKAGMVGVGTTNPLNTLDVNGVNGASAGIYFNDALPSGITNTVYNIGGLLYWNGGLIGGFGTLLSGGGTVNYLPKWTATTTLGNSVMYESAGNVGIGTTSPAQKLDVSGAVALSGVAALEQSGSSLRINQANQFYNGIYTGSSALRIGGTTGLIAGSAGADGQIALVPNGANNTRRITLDGGAGYGYFSGNVGIGTTSPYVKLDVAGNELRLGPDTYNASYSVTSGGKLVVDKSTGSVDSSLIMRDQGVARSEIGLAGDNNVHFKTATGAVYGSEIFTDRLLIYSTGAVDAIGGPLRSYATSGAPKIISGSSSGTAGTGLEMSYDFTSVLSRITSILRPSTFRPITTTGNNLVFKTGTASVSERVRIDNTGNVGIGTASPAERLTIIGNERLSGSFFTGPVSAIYTQGYATSLKIDGPSIQMNANGSPDNVGIGTTSPGTKLDVQGVINAATGYRLAAAAADGSYLRGDGANFVPHTLQASEVDAIIGGAPNLTLGVINADGSATTFVHTDATLLTFDAVTPADLGAAGPGAATTAAMSDHVHAAAALAGASVTGILTLDKGGLGQSNAGTADRYLKGSGTSWGTSSVSASGTGACGANTWASTLRSDNSPSCTQPAFSDLSSSATLAQLPYGSANQLLGTNNSHSGAEYKTFSTGSAGNDFNIDPTAANLVTFNLPSAGAAARGVVTTSVQTFAGAKTFNDTITNSASWVILNGALGGITFSGTGPNQIITGSGVLAFMPGSGAAVGIGKTVPTYTLDVNGVADAATGFRVANAAAAASYLRGNGSNFVSGTIQTGDVPAGWLANLGSQTIGLTAATGSTATGTAMRSDAAPALNTGIVPTWTGMHTFSNATYSAVFTGGNVGIGTAAPVYKLDVRGGSIRASTDLYEYGAKLSSRYFTGTHYYTHCINPSGCAPPACAGSDTSLSTGCGDKAYNDQGIPNPVWFCERECCHPAQ